MLEFRVLGPLEVRGANGEVALGGRKQSLLLAVFLLRAGYFVSREALIDALWPEDPPRSASPTIEVYVSRLRGMLHAAGAVGEVIQSGPAGYRLIPDGSRIDVNEFQRLLEAARTALERGDVVEAPAGRRIAVAVARAGTRGPV